jgi:hypothetical protein
MSQDTKELKLAVLIDADNVPYSNVKGWKKLLSMEHLQQNASMPIGRINGMENCFVRICNHTNSASYTVERTRQIQRLLTPWTCYTLIK